MRKSTDPRSEYNMTPLIFQALHELFPKTEIRVRTRSLKIHGHGESCGDRWLCEVDFVCPRKKLAIEYLTEFSCYGNLQIKEQWLKDHGYTLVILHKKHEDLTLDGIKSRILSALSTAQDRYTFVTNGNSVQIIDLNQPKNQEGAHS